MVLHLKSLVAVSFLFIASLASSNARALDSAIYLPKQKIKLAHKIINVEVANTPEEHQQGLMFRTKMPKDEGMLFVFDQEQTLSFWMKNTYLDLSIAYFNKEKKIINILEMKATNPMMVEPLPSYPSKGLAKYALEMNKEWFKKNKIKEGDQFLFLPEKKSIKK